jgi:L-lactate dehydrogenase complex protein LldE
LGSRFITTDGVWLCNSTNFIIDFDLIKPATPMKPNKVYFFGTCLINSIHPETGISAVKILKQEGLQVIFPKDQTCCGQPAYNAGYPYEARKVARQQIRLFPKEYPIVVPSGSCAGMMKHYYPKLFKNEPDLESVKEFSSRITEFTEFLVRVLKIRLSDEGDPVDVTWHSSCHAAREMKVIEDSKSLLNQLKQVNLLDLANEEQCCGFGGTFSIKQPDISEAMVKDKVQAIKDSGASQVISGDWGCLMNIIGALEFQKVPILGQHIADFIRERCHGK